MVREVPAVILMPFRNPCKEPTFVVLRRWRRDSATASTARLDRLSVPNRGAPGRAGSLPLDQHTLDGAPSRRGRVGVVLLILIILIVNAA